MLGWKEVAWDQVLGASPQVCDLKQAASHIQALVYCEVKGVGFINFRGFSQL